jgi:TRAP-type C4-dicarboxylate transport system permease small subunit
MSIVLKIVLFIILLPLGAGIIYRSGDRIHASVVEYRSATGRDICLLVETFFVLVYCGLLIWYFFVR